MNRILIVLTSIILFIGCNSKPPTTAKKGKSASDSVKKRKTTDYIMANADRPDSEQEGPTFDEVKADLLSTYNKIEHIDTLVIIGNDTLHIHEKYYCLHDSALTIPKKYIWAGRKEDFVTHNFVSSIVIIKNRDTIINRIFRKSDFNSALHDEEKQYAILFNPNFHGYSKLYDGVVFDYSISIPLTDVGVPAYIVVDKKGRYKILDEYAKINEY